MRLAVIGSRRLNPDLSPFVSLFADVTEIISGGAAGVDRCAETYANAQGIPLRVILPDYGKYGKAAPLIRDREIVKAAHAVLAIWDGTSRGTAYTVAYAKKLGIPVRVFIAK